MLEAFYILVAAQILIGLYSIWTGFAWLQMARRSLARQTGFFTPRVAVICPVKGIEPGLEQNLAALAAFDYPGYQIFFSLARTLDPAYDVLRRIVAASKTPAHIVVAGPPAGCSDKVNNLRAGLAQLPPEFDVVVFADSDGRPGRQWLGRLVAPLWDARVGAATTMRWMLPESSGFLSALAAAWNAPAVTLHTERGARFCWGGGTAIRRAMLEQLDVQELWRGASSDDYALTRALHAARRAIAFVPECLVPSPHDTDLRGLLEFTNRQMILTRVYAPSLWGLALAAHGLYCIALVGVLGTAIVRLFSGAPALHTFLLALAIPLLAVAHGAERLMAVTEILPAWRAKLLQFGWAWTLLAALVPFLIVYNCIVAAFSRRIVWRGARYRIVSPSQTEILM
jgi:ceramide glucosyltransferase